ncbi:AraC family transcriptional regulator [Burkholderia cenocepacia]|jgi:AraC-like DNA-binding protein|uniref:helix-turn-helix domain-containing protein n=1 Tax=Burkholderia cenocepacia TaxID=95486 RepID=UPI0004F69684|nr:AraC family transcriptional regulator [Burkholderia cenocepacia]AIO46550.1 helix-turn-helix domain protein [Burkholderia cepacia]KGC01120.1 helix-turn-helix domain protein [Burkholderia cepacia]MCG0579116.1 AraC family transcriptional regulator [Burkholderia cenocepacia]MCW3523843.1 AraC family transcriptional regulator [Burkholderia cenocepacia]MCW3611973.1 AraC family transcriptional regulator [Burkholderia cenocepacia]
MKPQYEHVTFASGCSIRVYHRQLARIPFEWHRHPEYGLTLTLNSRGQRFIGDHVAHYADDDLVLVPPNLPHTWSSNARIDRDAPEVALVVWFDGDWARRLADCCPEYAPLRSLLRRAAPGLRFDGETARAMRARLPLLLDPSPRVRLAATLDTLADLAEAGGEPLATAHAYDRPDGAASPADPAAPEAERLDRVLDAIDRHFHEPLRIDALAAAAHMSERTLQRLFVRHLGESVGRYVQRLRLAHACRHLVGTDWPIATVAARCGIPNAANFNRQFLAARGTTPGAYRQFFKQHGHAPDGDAPALDTRPPSLERRTGSGQHRPPK